jgi:hypothetical protein
MKRILVIADESMDNAYGYYDDPDSQCHWTWDSISQEIVDTNEFTSHVVGYAKTLAEVLS